HEALDQAVSRPVDGDPPVPERLHQRVGLGGVLLRRDGVVDAEVVLVVDDRDRIAEETHSVGRGDAALGDGILERAPEGTDLLDHARSTRRTGVPCRSSSRIAVATAAAKSRPATSTSRPLMRILCVRAAAGSPRRSAATTTRESRSSTAITPIARR